MENIGIDISQKWNFIYPQIIEVSTPIEFAQEKKGYSFTIPYGEHKIQIFLEQLIPDEDKISGRYVIRNKTEREGTVDFTISDQGKKLIGDPSGFHGTHNWKIVQVSSAST